LKKLFGALGIMISSATLVGWILNVTL